jgi:hypothetical protein
MRKKHLLILFLSTIIMFVSDNNSVAGNKTEKPSKQIRLALSKTVSRDSVNVVIHVYNYIEKLPYSKSWQWGVERINPKYVIGEIDIKIGNMKIFVPLSAFMDLANPREAKLENIDNDGFKLSISGGDAATSYIADLYVKGGFVQKRKVMHGEFPEESYELTVYSHNSLN